MKPLRVYHTRGSWVWCRVDFFTDENDWNDDADLAAALARYSIYMRATVLYEHPKSDKDCPNRFSVRAHSNIPRDIVFREALYFLQTLKQMYQL